MSNHLASRWYRAPEIILNEKQHDEKMDIWSVGCIFAELIQYTDVYKEKCNFPEDRILFRG